MVACRPARAGPCRWTEPSPARLCPFGQGAHTHPRVALGTRSTPATDAARPADTTLRTNHGQGTAVTPHHGSERRCTHQSHTTLAGYSRRRRGMLRAMARSGNCQRPRRIRRAPHQPFAHGLHVTETIGRPSQCLAERQPLPHRHRRVAAQRPRRAVAHTTLHTRRPYRRIRSLWYLRLLPGRQTHPAR